MPFSAIFHGYEMGLNLYVFENFLVQSNVIINIKKIIL